MGRELDPNSSKLSHSLGNPTTPPLGKKIDYIMSPKDTDRMANSVDPDQTAASPQ